MNKANTISVIIVTYNTGSQLWRAIESVLVQDHLHEIIIVNNGNPLFVNERLDNIKEQYPQIKLLNNENIGFAKACNLGVQNSSGEYILILNPDCIMKTKEDFSKLLLFFKIKKNATLVGCKILNPNLSLQKTSIRNQLNIKILFVEGLLLYKLPIFKKYFPRINISAQNISKPTLVDAISGAFMMIKRVDYESFEGMDEGYFLHCEDIDFCRRIKNEGGNIYYVPNVEIVHYLSTSQVSSNIVEWHKLKGFIRYFYKFYNIYTAILLTPILTFRYTLKSIKSLICGFSPKGLFNILYSNNSNIENELFNTQDFECGSSVPSELQEYPIITLAGSMNQVGVTILKNLLVKKYKINVLYRNSSINFHSRNIKWVQVDFSKKNNIENLNSEVLICTISLWLLPNLLNSLNNTKLKRLICFSSTSIFTKFNSKNLEDRNLVRSLKLAEKEVISICERKNIAYTILRPTMIYGIGLDKGITLLSNFIKMFKFFPLFNEARGLRQPVNVLDLANTAVKIINNEKTFYKCYNLGGGENITYKEMLTRIFEYYNIKARFVNFIILAKVLKYICRIRGFSNFSEIIDRMNKDMVFDNKKNKIDFEYSPRKFLQ